MKTIVGNGIAVGVVVSLITVLEQPAGSTTVSSLPAFSFVTLVVLSAIVLRRVLPQPAQPRQVLGIASTFGVTAGAIDGLAAILRGYLVWTRLDPMLAVIAFVFSCVTVVVIANVVAWVISRRSSPSPAVPLHRSP